MAAKRGSMVAVWRHMGGEGVARVSDIDRKGILRRRVWMEEANIRHLQR